MLISRKMSSKEEHEESDENPESTETVSTTDIETEVSYHHLRKSLDWKKNAEDSD